MKKQEIKFRPVTFNIDEPLLQELDDRVAAEQAKRPESALTRSEVARWLLRHALELTVV